MITLMVACSKSPSPQQPLPEIGFTLDLDTKSAVDNSNLHVAGSQITVYDVHSRTSPSEEDQSEAGLVQYIDGKVLECDGVAWNFRRFLGQSAELMSSLRTIPGMQQMAALWME